MLDAPAVALPPVAGLPPESLPEAPASDPPPLDAPESALLESPSEEHPPQMVTSAPK